MAKTMWAAVVHGFGKPLKIEEVPIPTPGRGEVLIKMNATGVCHTDLHATHGDWPIKPKPPFIPGHEGTGIVTAVGPGVVGVKEGNAVGTAWLHEACGRCECCETGWETLCEPRIWVGTPTQCLASRRIPDADLRRGAETHYHSRLDRRHAQGPC